MLNRIHINDSFRNTTMQYSFCALVILSDSEVSLQTDVTLPVEETVLLCVTFVLNFEIGQFRTSELDSSCSSAPFAMENMYTSSNLFKQ